MIDVAVTGSVRRAFLDSAQHTNGIEADKKNVKRQIPDFLKFLTTIASSSVRFIENDIVSNFNYIVFCRLQYHLAN
jgi:hypothetical protein